MTKEDHSVTKLSLLKKTGDYIHWRRRVYAYLRRDDAALVGLSDKPEQGSSRMMIDWVNKSTKAKSNIILALGAAALSQTRQIIDNDEKTAKDLWDELAKIYTTTSSQAIQNLRQKLDALAKDWTAHVTSFLSIFDELAIYDDELTPKEKVSKLIRSLPSSFSALAMVCTVTDTTFDKVKSAVTAEIARRANPNNPQTSAQPTTDKQANVADGNNRGNVVLGRCRGGRGGRGRRGRRDTFNDRTCHYCGKPGHFISIYRSKLEDEARGNVHRTRPGGPQRYRRGRPSRYGRGQPFGRVQQPQAPYQGGWWNNQVPPSSTQGQLKFGTQYAPQAQPSSQHAAATFQQNQHFPLPDTQSPSFDTPQDFRDYMAVMFRSTVARIGEEKDPDALIDSGATHSFFYHKSSFRTYTPMAYETVQAAHGTTIILGRGTVWIPIDGGLEITAYHTPHFTSNILAVSQLSKHFDLLFTSRLREKEECIFMHPKSRHIIFDTPCQKGLYKMPLHRSGKPRLASQAKSSLAANKPDPQI